MGERQSDGGLPGRRRVHPGRPASGPLGAADAGRAESGRRRPAGLGGPGLHPRNPLTDAELEALLAASLTRGGIDAEAEQRALAAFRAARDARAHQPRTRRRDDWRPRERRHPGRSLKVTFSVLIASLTLGGVAAAAIGAVGLSGDGAGEDRERPPASTSAPGESPGEPSSTSTGTGTGSATASPDRPASAQDTEAHCRAYEQLEGRGQALDATAWKRLVAAAGGERNVTAYCAGRLSRATAEAKPGKTTEPDKGAGAAGNAGSGSDSGNANNGTGNTQSGADSGAGSGANKNQGRPAQPNGRQN